MMKLMLLTGDVEFAQNAQTAGVDRIFLDLEYINKADRQKGRNTYITQNTLEDIAPLRNVLTKSELLVRINPIHLHSRFEIEKAIEYGADILMLPMVTEAKDVEIFVKMVNGRVKTCPMIETAQALVRIDDIVDISGIDELFIGLNDLHISTKLTFMFELLSGGIIEYLSDKIKSRNIPFGFGGIAKIGEGILPAECILGEHYRLGSTSVILSRTFRNENSFHTDHPLNLVNEIEKIRLKEKEIKGWKEKDFESNKKYVKRCVKEVVSKI